MFVVAYPRKTQETRKRFDLEATNTAITKALRVSKNDHRLRHQRT
jgi:hypothetical protein